MTTRIPCDVCGKVLRNPRSIALRVGPVCARRVRAIIQGVMEATGQLASGIAERSQELYRSAITSAQEAYRNRIRRRRNQEEGVTEQEPTVHIPADRTVTDVWSESRGQAENIQIEFSDDNHAIAQSQSGHRYSVTATSCTCPHFRHRLRGEGRCRHINAFLSARGSGGETVGQQAEEDRTDRLSVEVSEELHEANRSRFFEIDWTDEQQRESVLDSWRQSRAFDGIYMSEDDQAWQNLYERANHQWDYRYENVLGGTGNSFGVELEFEMPNYVSREQVAEALYRADIIDSPSVRSYHSGSAGPGYWKLERDGSLENGLELVSPVLFDKPEHWKQIEKATVVLRELGVRTSVRTGGHIHIGIAPLDHRTYSWQRLSRIGNAYERIFYRMGGADSIRYEATGQPGVHRGSGYTSSLPYTSRYIRATDTAVEARVRLSNNDRYTMFNATNVDATDRNQKPTIEMRYPNSSLDHRQIQAQIMVANAVVHQAAVIRQESPLNRFTPGLNQTAKHYRLNDGANPDREEKSFRNFLDVLGNPEDRLAATWLYRRGSVN